MQLRTSPGGSMLNSLRNRPLEPPSSLTVTTAQSCEIRGESEREETVYFLRPLSSVERPVPPPIATTRNSRLLRSGMGASRSPHPLLLRVRHFATRVGIEKLGETRIFGEVLEIRIVAHL